MFFVLRSPNAPWGDYGNILLQGMSMRDRPDELLRLERTGPFVPPLSFPWSHSFVVTDRLRRELEASTLTGFTIRPVVKHRIVRLAWERWDLTAPKPPRYPSQGEPENYILGRKHQPAVAVQMGDLWEVVLEEHADAERTVDAATGERVTIVLVSTWDGADLFSARASGYSYASVRGRDWLLEHAREWVRFEEAPTR